MQVKVTFLVGDEVKAWDVLSSSLLSAAKPQYEVGSETTILAQTEMFVNE